MGIFDVGVVGTIVEGAKLGTREGLCDGSTDGSLEGRADGSFEGANEGRVVGKFVGLRDGNTEGNFVGLKVGVCVVGVVNTTADKQQNHSERRGTITLSAIFRRRILLSKKSLTHRQLLQNQNFVLSTLLKQYKSLNQFA